SGCMQIIHPSLAEYLLGEGSKKFHINMELIHQTLFQQSTCVMLKQLKFNICQLETSYLKNSDVENLYLKIQDHISSELQYACLYWSHHLVSTESTNTQLEFLLGAVFVNVKTLMWIECLSLLNKIFHGIDSIKKLYLWLNKVNPSQISGFYEVYYFLHKFYIPIVMSTPHIYLSALPFAPVHSVIYKKCSHLLPVQLVESTITNQQWQAKGLLFPVYKDIGVIKFSPKNSLLYSGFSDGSIGIWNPYTGEPVALLSGHEHQITTLLLTKDGNTLISGSVDTTIRFWDTITCKSLHQPLYCHTRTITSIALSTDDSALYCGSLDKTISIWNTSNAFPSLLYILQCPHIIKSLVISTKYIISGNTSNLLHIWNIHSYEKVTESQLRHKDITTLAVSSTVNQAACGTVRGYISVWNLERYDPVYTHIHPGLSSIDDILYTQDGKYLITSTKDRGIIIYDTSKMQPFCEPLISTYGEVHRIAISQDEHFLCASLDTNHIQVWDLDILLQKNQINSRAIQSFAWSEDNNVVALSCDSVITLHDYHSMHQFKKIHTSHTNKITCLSISSDNKRILLGSSDYTIEVWDIDSGELPVDPITGFSTEVCSVVFLAKSAQVAGFVIPFRVIIWSIVTGEIV
ncbi:WD40 repeat-like protein, partial [Pluteus cervinus]